MRLSSSWIQQGTSRTVGKGFQALVLMLGITLLLFGGLGSRLVYLQLIEGSHNRQLADENRIRLIPKQPERGKVLDRKGRLLASSRLSHAVFIWPLAKKKAKWATTLSHLSNILKLSKDTIQRRVEQEGSTSTSLLRIARSISPAQITALQERKDELDGVEVDAEAIRYYPNGDLASHVLGYTGELTDEELGTLKPDGYRLGDVIGQMGAEQSFERQLRGEWGGQQVEVDGWGQVLRILGEKPTRAGNDIHLTIDLDIQKAAEKALGKIKGAVVAMDPDNGAILAMVSRPAFDPNIFSGLISQSVWKDIQSRDHPFVNRALQAFPPASTFKIVTTTAAIESGNYPANTVLNTFPFLTVGGIQFWDWNRAGFGPLDFPGAMAMSSDTFFYQVAVRMGEKPLLDWSRRYGFGRKTGIELGIEESRGLVPDDDWKRKEIGEPWYGGDTVNSSIGQGFFQTTPLQVAVMFAVPANGGYLVKPHLLKDNEESRNWRESLNLRPDTIKVLKEGLRQVVTGGTGQALNVPNQPPIAGKSGTAEDPPRKSHTWFGAYAPDNKPEIVVVAFGENSGGGGGSLMGPIALKVIEEYFKVYPPKGSLINSKT